MPHAERWLWCQICPASIDVVVSTNEQKDQSSDFKVLNIFYGTVIKATRHALTYLEYTEYTVYHFP